MGVVVIGRNEGDRLRRCLESVAGRAARVVYVDSGSTDGSAALARNLGAEVVELDMSSPFSAARARNAGFDRLLELDPHAAHVMFVDGDCEVRAGWLEAAASALEAHPDRAVVFGRLREREPDASLYNRLCDMEWDVPPGVCDACGGICVVRSRAFREAGRFNPSIVAGEEPELCVRLRRAGWTIERLDAEMAWHDAAMTRFSQWWKRAVRAGHAFAEGAALHGRSAERHYVRESVSIWLWAFVLPLAAVSAAWFTRGASLGLLAAYPVLWGRIALRRRRDRTEPWSWCLLYAAACLVAKPAMLIGQLRYIVRRLLGRGPQIIEHKGPPA